jgi:hypothetical protein
MSAAHDLLARPSAAATPALIGAETVVELVPPRWRWRVISPGQWRVLSRLDRRARVRDLVPPGGGDVAEVVELVTELVTAGFLVAEESSAEAEPEPPVSEPAGPGAEPYPAPADDGPAGELSSPEPPGAEPPVAEWPFVDPPADEPPADELPADDPSADHWRAEAPGGGSPETALPSGGPVVGLGAWPPIWRDPDRGPAPVAEPRDEPPVRPSAELSPRPSPRPAPVDPPGAAHSAPAGVRPYVPEPVPTRPPSWPAPGAHRADPAPQAPPPVDGGLHLPRREPGRALPPASAVLRQRHERVRLPGGEHVAPDAQVLRRLLGSLQQLEVHGSAERDGAS